jgi:hypothetical protein
MMVSGDQIGWKGEVICIHHLMISSIKEIGLMINSMDLVYCIIRVVLLLLRLIIMILLRLLKIGQSLKEILKMISNKDMEYYILRVKRSLVESLIMILFMGKVLFI